MAPRQSSPSLPPSSGPVVGADYNLRILWTLARYVEDTRGNAGLDEFAEAGGLNASDFDGKNRWVSASSFEALLAKARSFVSDEDQFKAACVHRIKEAYGPLRYLLWATSVPAVFAAASKQYGLVSQCGDLVIAEHSRTWARMTFTSRTPIYSRLNCLARQAQSAALPTLWGLPPAHIRETACIAHGDACCELHYRWYAARRWTPAVLGAAASGLLGYALVRLGLSTIPTPLGLAFIGGLVGYLWEVRRTERINARTREEVMEALRELAHGESDARRELLGMHQRQKEWTRLVEEEMSSRTAAIQNVVSGIQEVQSARASTLMGFSHDLRNPLQIIQMSAEYLEANAVLKADKDVVESVSDIHQAVEKMRIMLGELVQVTKAHRAFVTMAPQVVSIPGLTGGLQRRLRALVHGRDVRSTVFATREAPGEIEIDPLALDRILDNLLTNAAKYTERGSIVVEVDGTPGYIVLKVSDTGCGIPAESLDGIFEPGGSNPRSRRGDSFGVGLSVVVQLLDQIGGRLEVMSRVASGTTFWVYLPLVSMDRRSSLPEVSKDPSHSQVRELSPAEVLSRVVKIRKLPA